jgi:hypothetical protein
MYKSVVTTETNIGIAASVWSLAGLAIAILYARWSASITVITFVTPSVQDLVLPKRTEPARPFHLSCSRPSM